MRTEVTELPESRARLEVGVEPELVAKRIDSAAKQLAGEMKLPGFRKGKVPAELVIQRLGREAVLDQAIREGLPEWYDRAITESGLTTVGDPKLDVDSMPAEGEELVFSIEIGVRPPAKLGQYRGLEVGRAEPEVDDEAVAAELERLREGFGSLNPVERASAEGDVVVVDYVGRIDGEAFEGGDGADMTIELGASGLLEEFDAGLRGVTAGEAREIEVTFPGDYGAESLRGKQAVFAVEVKEVREKELPTLDDEFAQAASEFDTLGELREEIAVELRQALEQRADAEFKDAAVEAAVENAMVEIPHDLAHARAHELWERTERALAARGIDPQMYARVQGKDRHELISEGEDSAALTLRREATLAAVADAERIEPTDDELIDALGPGDGKDSAEQILMRLRENGREDLLREEVRQRKAAELIAESAKPIAKARAAAREAIWTPEKEAAEQAGEGGEKPRLWTPWRERSRRR